MVDGSGIFPDFDIRNTACPPVSTYLPLEGDISLNDVLIALLRGCCDIESLASAMLNFVDGLEAEYDIADCLTALSPDLTTLSGTHAILQAVVYQVCQTVLDVSALQSSLSGYVLISDLNAFIDDYMATYTNTKMYNKMIPYVAMPYFGDISGKFDTNGVGYGDWEQVYLCNGYNGITPDFRGFSPVGAITGMGGGSLNPIVTGLTYSPGDAKGEAAVKLTIPTMPAHTHDAVSTDSGHTHLTVRDGTATEYAPITNTEPVKVDSSQNYTLHGTDAPANAGLTSVGQANISTTISSKGGDGSHNNIPPVRASYFIMYCP